MNTPERSFADALLDAHTALLRDLQELEKYVAPTSSESLRELGSRLEQVRTHLAEHFRFEEDGGYMAAVLKEEPRLSREVQELLTEHSQIALTLDAIIEEVARVLTVQNSSRQRIHAWLQKIRHHESREHSLVQEAYYSSGATGD
jgi:type VI protein secretion system component VasF